MKRVCVYCGSGVGRQPDYAEAARVLGDMLVQDGIGLVYGGGKIGMMGVLAQTVLDGGGEVIGVIPKELFERELALTAVTDLRIVDGMHERKALMAELSDAFVALPGGLGTVEEFFEILTWAQLGYHTKPCGLLNVCHYFDNLIRFVDHAVAEDFIEQVHRDLFLVEDEPESLLDALRSFEMPQSDKAKWALRQTREIERGIQ